MTPEKRPVLLEMIRVQYIFFYIGKLARPCADPIEISVATETLS